MSNCFFGNAGITYNKVMRLGDGNKYRVYGIFCCVLFSNNTGLNYRGTSRIDPTVSRFIKRFKITSRINFRMQSTGVDGVPYVSNESDVRIYYFCCKQKIGYVDMIDDPLDIPLYGSPQNVVYNKTENIGSLIQEIPATPGIQAGFKVYDTKTIKMSSKTNLALYPGEEFVFYILTEIRWRDSNALSSLTTTSIYDGFDYEIRYN